jgi:hypothetical protein
MTPKLFYSLSIAAALSLAAAGGTYYTTRSFTSAVEAGDPLFPDLLQQAGDVASLTVIQGTDTITVERSEDGWGISERNGFPANADEIRETIVGMTRMLVVESKTRNEERYELLQLEDPAAEDANSKLVQLRDADGDIIAEVVLGKIKYGLLGPGRNGVYARVPGDPQSWLVSGDISAPLDVRGWADKKVFEFSPAEISRVTISHADGDRVVLVRDDPESEEATFRLENLPDGETLADDADLEFQVRSLGQLELWDVRVSGTVEPPEGASETTIDVATVDGINVTMHLVSDGEEDHWVTMSAWGVGDAADAARELSERARGWSYQIQSYKANVFGKRLAELLAATEEDGGS